MLHKKSLIFKFILINMLHSLLLKNIDGRGQGISAFCYKGRFVKVKITGINQTFLYKMYVFKFVRKGLFSLTVK